MGLFDGLFRRKPKNTKLALSLDGVTPWYGQFGTDIYASDVVRQALQCIVGEMKKLNPTHIRYENSDPVPVKGNVQDILDFPNPLMTSSDFLEKVVWMLLLNDNAFVIPVYKTWTQNKVDASGNRVTIERRSYEALYPINPTNVDFIEDASGELYVNFWFWNGYQTTIPYKDVIHIRENYSVSEYMGGNRFGQPDHAPIIKTLELHHELLNGIAKAMKASCSVNGIVKYASLMDKEKTQNAINEFHERLRRSDSGILPIDMKAEYIPIQHDVKIVDEPTLEFFEEKILRNWSVPLCILKGDYTQEQYNAFYQKSLEHRIKAISQAFTKGLFTSRELAFGNRIELYPKDLIFLNPEQTLRLIEVIAPQGGGYVNEYRTWLGLRPLPELEGKRYMSLNWIDADNAAQYQVGMNENVEVIDENKTVEG